MADSDAENEKFVENVMHELQAFHITDRPKTDSERAQLDDTGVGGTGNGRDLLDTERNSDSSGKSTLGDGKTPTRIIKLSRPSTQFNLSRAKASNQPELNASSSQNASNNENGTSAVSGAPAPGSRLAALQRPGSPFHKYLQRAQSPALAAAAKLTKPASIGSADASADSASNIREGKTEADAQVVNGERSENDTFTSASTSETQTRSSILPPRIQSSALTSSVLLRRPQSPLHGARGSHIPINKQVAGVASEQSDSVDPNNPHSPKSPKSNGPASPGITAANSITSADKVAIRNKLRANSFRLKDLLTKRPYGKSKDLDSETKDDSATTAVDRLGHLRSASLDKGDEDENKTDKPRVSAVLLRSRSRAQGERPPPTLISAKSLRTRSADKPHTEVVHSKEQNVSESTTCAKNENISKGPERMDKVDAEKSDIPHPSVSADHKPDETNSVPNTNSSDNENHRNSENKINVGATLIRSPRTRILSAEESPVPCDKTHSPKDISKESHNITHDSQNFLKDVSYASNIPHDNHLVYEQNSVTSQDQSIGAVDGHSNDELKTKSKSILDIEKDKEATLVFDSETIGQSEQNFMNTKATQSPNTERVHSNLINSKSDEIRSDSHKNDLREIQEARKSAKEQFLSQSISSVSGSTPRWRDWKRQRSEPGSTITDTMKDSDKLEKHHLSVDDSKSSESAVEMSRSSPAMKRSLAVTDLDKAMIDRDQQKLSSMFKDGDQEDSAKYETRPKGTVPKDLETDLDALRGSSNRVSKIQERMCKSQDENPTSPTSPSRTEPIYKPSVNLEDAVKWPQNMPGKLDFREMAVFEGQMLLNWLTSSIDKSHYLRLVMTKHDISVIACQICTCLIAAGVIRQLETKDVETVFKPDCMYYWTHTQTSASEKSVQDVNKLPPMWPPNQNDSPEKPGLKYTEADHQAAMVTLRHEYKDEVEKIQKEHQGVLDKARHEYETRLQQAIERIAILQKEVEKYRCLAGIEKLTQAALSDADAARIEAGLQSDETQSNGYSSPSSGTPSVSQYHTPAVTPDCVSLDIPMNMDKSSHELFNDITTPNELRPDGVPAPPPAPPAPPPFPEVVPPPPPPAPPPMTALQRIASLKPVINPRSPMKPLFWQRIQVHEVKTPKHKEYYDAKLVWEDIREEEVNIDELDEMFSKTAMITSRRFSPNKPKAKAKEVAKIIIPKRAQTIGIFLSSLRLEMSEIEDAILKFDTSQLSEEKLRQIYENRGSDEEIKKIKDHLKKHPDIPLDKPDQFLYDLSLIPDYAERIFCFIFQQAFQDSISVIESKMINLRMTCRNLMSSVNIKRILGLVLALGNYMNGGNKSRGQADGFGLEILPKLKDVKSKDNMSSLLHYTVYQYIKKFEKNDAGTEKVSLPLPDPSDMSQAMGVNFDELSKELIRIQKDFEEAEKRADKVIQSATEPFYLQPFKDTMTAFFQKGRQEFQEQEDNLAEGKKIFQETVIFFCVKPKSGDKVVTPEYFFSLWAQFCQDFKTIWKREQQKLLKQRVKENELRVKKIQENMAKKPVRTRVRKAGGLKDRLAKQGLLDT